MAAIGQARCGVAGGGERAARGAPRERGPSARSSVFALRVRGTGMAEDGLYDGDRLIVERGAPADGRMAGVEVDGRLAVKRVCRDGESPAPRGVGPRSARHRAPRVWVRRRTSVNGGAHFA